MAKSEDVQSDYKDTEAYARRSIAAAQGTPTLPDDPRLRIQDLPADTIPDLSDGRQRLVAALDRDNRKIRPQVAAHAQVMYDCWLEQQAEHIQPDHIKACRDRFTADLAELEKPFPAPPPPPKAQLPERYLVFFDWNKATLTPEGRRIVASAAQAYNEKGRGSIIDTGYTDRSGSAKYNQKLSVRRAETVKAELIRLGVPATAITAIGRGESDPLVPTADGVREPQNRRVEIQIQKPGS
jgi:OOP family OmpA-OmpF porin